MGYTTLRHQANQRCCECRTNVDIFMHIHSPKKGKLDPGVVKYKFLWDIRKLKRDISVTIHHPNFIFFVSTDVTFNESEYYFPTYI